MNFKFDFEPPPENQLKIFCCIWQRFEELYEAYSMRHRVYSLPEQYQSDNDGKSSDSESSVESASRIARPTAFQSSQLRGRQSELENERRNTKQTLRTSLAGCEVNERLVNKFGSVKDR